MGTLHRYSVSFRRRGKGRKEFPVSAFQPEDIHYGGSLLGHACGDVDAVAFRSDLSDGEPVPVPRNGHAWPGIGLQPDYGAVSAEKAGGYLSGVQLRAGEE